MYSLQMQFQAEIHHINIDKKIEDYSTDCHNNMKLTVQ